MKRETIENIVIVIGCLILITFGFMLINERIKTSNEIKVLEMEKEGDTSDVINYLNR